MSKLTATQRKSLPSSDFAVPSRAPKAGSYPVPDKPHAKAALSMVSRFGSSAQKAAVREKVAKKFPGIGKGTQKAPKE